MQAPNTPITTTTTTRKYKPTPALINALQDKLNKQEERLSDIRAMQERLLDDIAVTKALLKLIS